MVCDKCQELLSDYIDGSLELGEQLIVERHLADCAPCRVVRDDLLQIVHFSRQLPEQAPSNAIWSRIQSEIAAQRPTGFWSRAATWWARVQNRYLRLTIPQLAASAAALTIIVSIAVILSRPDAPTINETAMSLAQGSPLERNLLSSPDIKQIEHRIDELRETVEQRKVAWNPELRVAFDRNMLHIDQSLAECRQELNANPADQVSQDLMLNAYREKVRLLEEFAKVED
jgi:anti-sigma-K factor RskA